MALQDGKTPTASIVFVKTHTRKQESEIVFCDKQAKSVWDEFKRLKLNALQLGIKVTEDEIFLQAAGEVNEKCLGYGLGHSQSKFQRPLSGRSSTSSIVYTLLW